MFIATLINSNSPKLKHAKYPSKDKKVSKLWYIHKIEYFSATKKNKLPIQTRQIISKIAYYKILSGMQVQANLRLQKSEQQLPKEEGAGG